ncbi:MAG TPA: hypothetical protein V6C72_15530 [Chroococcales cyanobacterium]
MAIEGTEIEVLLKSEAMALAAITLLLDRSKDRQSQDLLSDCKNFHYNRKEKLAKLLGGTVTEFSLSMPEDVQQVLMAQKLSQALIIDFLTDLEQKLLLSYQGKASQFNKSALREMIAEFMAEQKKLLDRLNTESQSITQVFEKRRRPQ